MRACSGAAKWGRITLAVTMMVASLAAGARAQQSTTSSWPATTPDVPSGPGDLRGAQPSGPNTTEVPWTPSAKSKKSQNGAAATQVTLMALLTQDGQRIESGLVWRVFQDDGAATHKKKLVATSREASPVLRLPAGDYLVNAAFGRAHLTRRVTVKAGVQSVEPFVLNAGGLRVAAMVNDGEPAPPNSVFYEIFSDERDQFGNRTKIMDAAKPGVIVRLNSGIYHIVSTYGDANAHVRTDVTVEAGKLTEATVTHAAAKVTFKLVTRAGGEALADTQWTVLDAEGDVVKESVGALPTHTLAPGKYTATARSGGRVFRRDFSVQKREIVEVEVVMQ